MWAIGALSVILLVSIGHEAPDVVTGLVGVGFIGGAFASSLARNRRRAAVPVQGTSSNPLGHTGGGLETHPNRSAQSARPDARRRRPRGAR
jgi:hypothetical protein